MMANDRSVSRHKITAQQSGSHPTMGDCFGRWTAISRVPGDSGVRWLCRCDCGTERPVLLAELVNGRTLSCGCRQKEVAAARLVTHGHSKTASPIYRSWSSMRRRCNDPCSQDWPHYGGRGISICKEWDNFDSFRTWALANGWSKGLTIERKDVNGNYEPDNCCWATHEEQNKNRRSNLAITAFGATRKTWEWADDARCQVSAATLRRRLWMGWSPEDAITITKRGSPS